MQRRLATRRRLVLGSGALALGLTAFAAQAWAATPLSGRVVDPEGRPVAGARVHHTFASPRGSLRSAGEVVLTDGDGRFALDADAPADGAVYIGFAKVGYMTNAGTLSLDGGGDMGDVTIEPVSPIDNELYEWIKPVFPKEDRSDFGCNACHGDQARAWQKSAMSGSARNPWVLSYYKGTDLSGRPAGDGWLLDNPGDPGPCANCHAPAAAINAPGAQRLDEVTGVAENGVFCDVCHKIADVRPGAGPGVGGALVYARPSANVGLFAFGPYDDVGGHPMASSYSELIQTSRFCAGCHEWTNDAGVPVLSTFSEWSEMAGADPDALQCQDCHMKKRFGREYRGEPPSVDTVIVDDDHVAHHHAVIRQSSTVHPHEFPGGKELAPEAADLSVEGRRQGDELVVIVTVANANAGHALPTGMPFRHAILTVEAAAGHLLPPTGGSTVPAYGGEGRTDMDLAGLPGKGFARVLGDGQGGVNVPFWRATEVLEDTRVRPGEADEVEVRFALPEGAAEAEVTARLVYRRAFLDMARAKGWPLEDVEMGTVEATIDVSADTAAPDAPEGPPPGGGEDGAPEGGDGDIAPGPGTDGGSAGCGCGAVGGGDAPFLRVLAARR